MANSSDAQHVLIRQVERAIDEIETAPQDTVCAAHQSLVTGVVVLLRCQEALLEREQGEDLLIARGWEQTRLTLREKGLWALMVCGAGVALMLLATVAPKLPVFRELAAALDRAFGG